MSGATKWGKTKIIELLSHMYKMQHKTFKWSSEKDVNFKLSESTVPILVQTNDEKNVVLKQEKKKLIGFLKNLVRT